VTIGILTPDLNANALDFVRAAPISVGEKGKTTDIAMICIEKNN
jgi:hypothetical protein